jgi:hypothetical protein
VASLIFFLISCASEQALQPSPEQEAPALESLKPVELLIRASLDIRGIRPGLAELEEVLSAPESRAQKLVEERIEDYLNDPLYPVQLRNLFSSWYLTRQDSWYIRASDYGLQDEPAFARAAGEEPLQILGYIAEHDLPYYELVSGDWTMADEQLGAAWPVDYPAGESGWKKVHYTDGRPAAGILSTNGLWWRYMSNGSNANRARANAVSRILLCNDYLSKPISFDRNVNILDGDALNDALQSNPGCYSCHESLDPLAGYFWGFYYFDYSSMMETTFYHPEREGMWQDYTDIAPGYYGEPGYTLKDLGEQLAADPRLPQCVVERVYQGLTGVEPGIDETGDLIQHRDAFIRGDLKLKNLYRSILADPTYRQRVAKQLSVEQLASSMEDLTGFQWSWYGYDMMATDIYGLRTLAGGVDGAFVTAPATTATATGALVWERLAEASAWYVVAEDKANPEEARLFTAYGATPQSDPELFTAQLQQLHLRLYGKQVEAAGPEVEAGIALWEALYALEHSPDQAWAGVLSVLLRDPEFLFY